MSRIAEILEKQIDVDHSPKLKAWEAGDEDTARNPTPGVAEQHRRIEYALEKLFGEIEGREPSERELASVMERFGRSAGKHLLATNPYAKKLFAGHLFRAFQELAVDEECYAVTVYHPDLEVPTPIGVSCEEENAGEELKLVEKDARREFRRLLSGFSFLAIFDFSLVREPRNEASGPHDAKFSGLPHHHAIVFGEKAKIEAAVKRRLKDPNGGRGGSKVYKITTVLNLRGWLGYMCKDPRCTYRLIDWGKDRKMRRERMYAPQQTYLLHFYGRITKPELCMGSGLGLEIVQRAVETAGGSRRPNH